MREIEEGTEVCRQCRYVFTVEEMVELPEGVWVCDGCYTWLDDMLSGEEDDR